MSKWKITSKREAILEDGLWTICSLGVYKIFGCKSFEYIIKHVDTGKTKTVFAENEYDLGEIIADGEFDEELEEDNDDPDYDYDDSSDDDTDDTDDDDDEESNSNDDDDPKDPDKGPVDDIIDAITDYFESGKLW